jgi:hypothetical protein
MTTPLTLSPRPTLSAAGRSPRRCVKLVAVTKRTILALAAILLFSSVAVIAQQQYEDAATLSFVVLKDDNGKPVRNAAVVLHPVGKGGKQERGGIELKADAEGRAGYDGIPYGKLRVQVLATGFQTFGQDYEVDKPKLDIVVRLKRPQGQYSIYENHPGQKPDENKDEKKDDKPEK